MHTHMYPLKFEPILKQTIWGGDKIIPFKRLDSRLPNVGESWEVSAVEGSESVVASGPLRGRTLPQLVREYKGVLVGERVYARHGDKFPLLVKFIDAKQDLSIQVHPDDGLAMRRHGCPGKNEMWYVIGADSEANLIAGFLTHMSPAEYECRVVDGTLAQALHYCDVKAGDVLYIPAGRVHSIGAGTFVAEIQQSSDITYRIFDYGRRDKDGNPRQLHTALALDAIDFDDVCDDALTRYSRAQDAQVSVVKSPFFITNTYDLTREMTRDYQHIDSFAILICVEGACSLADNEGNAERLQAGDTVLLPAVTQSVKIIPSPGVKLLETYL